MEQTDYLIFRCRQMRFDSFNYRRRVIHLTDLEINTMKDFGIHQQFTFSNGNHSTYTTNISYMKKDIFVDMPFQTKIWH